MWRIILDRSCGNIRTKFDDPWTEQSVGNVNARRRGEIVAEENKEDEDVLMLIMEVLWEYYWNVL